MRRYPHCFQLFSFLIFGCLVVSSFGCGQSSGPNVQYVHGVITLDGHQLKGQLCPFRPRIRMGLVPRE